MKKLGVVLVFIFLLAGTARAAEVLSTGPGQGVLLPHPTDTNPCPGSTLWLNADGSYENGYAWAYGGVSAPYYGAFAEGYPTFGLTCGMQLMLSTLYGYYDGQTLDAYIWDNVGDNPANVLSVTTGVSISQPAIWPDISTFDIDVQDVTAFNPFIGFWGNWPDHLCGWFIAADQNGPGGLPRTNIAPGQGYPTGWNDPSVIWGPTRALGIGSYVIDYESPIETCTWGSIKKLYR